MSNPLRHDFSKGNVKHAEDISVRHQKGRFPVSIRLKPRLNGLTGLVSNPPLKRQHQPNRML